MVDPMLKVQDLETNFLTSEGVVHAIDGVSFILSEGKPMTVSNMSGSGESVSILSCHRLIPSLPGNIEAREAFFGVEDKLWVEQEQIRQAWGRQIGLVTQKPNTSLNSIRTIGKPLADCKEFECNPLDLYSQVLRSKTVTDLDFYEKYPHIILEGEIHPPINSLHGFPFCTRSPIAAPISAESNLDWLEIHPSHFVAIH